MLKIRHIVLGILLISGTCHTFSQRVSRDNHSGKWSDPETWIPSWQNPVTDSIRTDIVINGYVTSDASLSFSNQNTTLDVNDTLVVKGNLSISSRSGIRISNNGILLILGNLTIGNNTVIECFGYLVIRDNVIKNGSRLQGSAVSNDNPPKIFIGGSIPVNLSDAQFYPIFDQVNPATNPYPGSSFAYGNIEDLKKDGIYEFYSSLDELPLEDLFIPNVITPNNDGRNDNFVVRNSTRPASLLILNKWGGIEFSQKRYDGSWSGRNRRGEELPADTYFYVLDFGDGVVKRGSVLIIR